MFEMSEWNRNFRIFLVYVADTLKKTGDERSALIFLRCQPFDKNRFRTLTENDNFFQELFSAENPQRILACLDTILANPVLVRMNQLEEDKEQSTGVSSGWWRLYVWKAMVKLHEKAAYCVQIRCVPRPIFPIHLHRIFRFHIHIYNLQGKMSRFCSLKMSLKQRHRLLNMSAWIAFILRRFDLGKLRLL
jgi:hypothetical protein